MVDVGDVAAIVGAGTAAVTLWRAGRNLRAQLRPVVVAELQKHPYGQWAQELVVRNYGQTPARNLQVTFTPELKDPTPDDVDATTLTAALIRRFSRVISVLAPHAEMRQVYYLGETVGGSNQVRNKEPVPDLITVNVSYNGPGKWRKYTDSFDLDVHLIGLSTSVTSKDNPASQSRVVADGVAKIAGISKWP